MIDQKSAVPDKLWEYRISCTGHVFHIFAAYQNIDDLWDSIIQADMLNSPFKCWQAKGCVNLRIRPGSIVAVDQPYGTKIIQVNRTMRRQQDQQRRDDDTPIVAIMGQSVKNLRKKGKD